MKFSRLLVLSALSAVSLSVGAADLNERVAPEAPELQPVFGDLGIAVSEIDRTPVKFEVGKMYVLYNVTADKFYYQGCNWATQAAVDDTPLAVRFTLPDGKSLADAQLLFNDYNIYANSWMLSFFDSEAAIYTDRGTQTNYYWQVVDQGNNTYRLQASEANPTLKPSTNPGFVGFDDANASATWDDHGRGASATSMPLSPFLEEGEGHHIDWQFFNVPTSLNVWNDYFTAQEVYNKAEELKTLIGRAEAAGLDVSAAVAVYNNEASTLEQLQAAIVALQEAMASGISSGTPDSPSDATGMLASPSFDGSSASGWSGSSPGWGASGQSPAEVAEFYNTTFDMYQDLSGLPAGVYGLFANTAFRGSWDDFNNNANNVAFLYAKAGDVENTSIFNNLWSVLNTTTMAGQTEFGTTASEGSTTDGEVTYYAPNDPSAFRLYYEQGYYKNAVFFFSDGAARVGVKKSEKVTDTDWAMFDNFELKYYGNEAASYQKWVEESTPKFSENAIITPSYLEALQSLAAGKGATDAASAQAAVLEVKASQELQAVYANQRAWAKYIAMFKKAQAVMVDPSTENFAGELTDFIQEHEEDADEMSLTTEELEAACEEIARLIEKTIEDAKSDVKPGDYVTNSYLTNADFNKGGAGWTTAKGNVTYRVNIAEAYDTDFDVYQEVQNPKVGVYRLQLKGFFRMQRDDAAYQMYVNNEQVTDAGVYVGTTLSQNKTFLKCVYDEAVTADNAELYATSGMWEEANSGNKYPNTMESAAPCFAAGMYQNEAYGLVANEGETMRVGVSGNVTGANWICWDDFQLQYMGMDAATIKPILEKAAAELNLEQLMGKDVYAEAKAAKNAAQEQASGSDGEAMFEALKGIFAVRDKVTASVALFKNLRQLMENELIPAMNNPQNTEGSAAASDLFDALENGLVAGKCAYTDAEVPGLIAQMKSVMQWMQVPDADIAAAASDDAPVDMSGAILTNSFSDAQGMNSVTWWEGTTGYNFGNDAEQKSALMLEFYEKDFDMYQDIEHLPAGTYEVSLNAFKRGNADHDKANPTACDGAWLYAKAGDATASNPLPTIFAGSNDFETDAPNSMVTAQEFFARDGQPYRVRVIVKLTEGTLRVGVTQPHHEAADWVIMDDFQLSYLGANSAKEQTGDGIDTVDAALQQQAQFFTIDGRKATSAQKGLVIVKMGDKVVKRIQK